MTIREELIQYSKDCIEDKIISCKKHKNACSRFLRDIERENTEEFEYYWNEEEAQKIVSWFSYLRHSKGVLSGQAIILTTWQKFFVCQIYAWVDERKNRRFHKAFIEVARKNGKSQILSGVLLYEISATSVKYNELIETYCAGIKKDQSKIIFSECALMLNRSPLRKFFKITRDRIEHIKTKSFIKPLSKDEGKTGDGTNPACTCLDELHLHPTTDFYDMHETGAKARRNPLLLMITTAGFDLTRPCYTQEYAYCSNIIDPNSDVENEKYFVDILEVDKNDELTLENITKANPIVCSYKEGIDGVLQSLKEARDIPEKMISFLTKTCNIWVQAKDCGYMDMGKWKECEVKEIPYDLKGREVYVGLDMSAKIDLTSVAFIIPIQEDEEVKYVCFSHSFIPNRQKLTERTHKDKVSYEAWEMQGFLSVTDSEIVDQNFVIDYIIKTCEENDWKINTVVFDPSNASKIMIDMSNLGYNVVEAYQSHQSLNEATTGFREQVYCKNVLYTHNPLLNFAMSNAVVKTREGKIKIDKDACKKKIDPVDSMLCAFKLAYYHEFTSYSSVDTLMSMDW